MIVPINTIAQDQKQSPPPPPPPERFDHLDPVAGIFDIYDFQFEYYSKVRKILFEKLTDRPEIRFLIMPSFSPENVLDIEYDRKNDRYFIVYHICEKMIWDNKNWEKTKVFEYRKDINKESVDLIKTLFKISIAQTRYNYSGIMGLDGETYYFSYFEMGLKSGTTWSPSNGTKMDRLVKIGLKLIDLVKNDHPFLLDDKFKHDISDLTNEFKTLR
jgi:hypothetical protein